MERNVLTVNDDEAYTAKLEYVGGWVFMHCDVHINAISTVKRIKRQIKDVKAELEGLGYYQPLLSVTRNAHFAKLLKGRYLGQVCDNGETLGVWSWE